MFINEVCKKCSLDKKAIEYYVEQGLVSPQIQENGYRVFSEEDVEKLKKVSILRNLGLPVSDIQMVLSHQATNILKEISDKKFLEISALKEKHKLIQELASNNNWEQIHERLKQLKKTIRFQRLINVFPGFYGRYICLHFSIYLNEPITTTEQENAFCEIIDFLDNINLTVCAELQEYLNDVTINFDENFMENISSSVNNAIEDTERYICDNREVIESYMKYKQSDEYKTSAVYQLEQSLRQFSNTSGYNDVFIPAMCRLSKSYKEYHNALMKANDKFLEQYPLYGQ